MFKYLLDVICVKKIVALLTQHMQIDTLYMCGGSSAGVWVFSVGVVMDVVVYPSG